MPVRNFPSERGSLIVKFNVEFPTKLSAQQISGLLASLPDRVPEPSVDEKGEVTKVGNQSYMYLW